MRIALVHDQLQEFGGAERVLVALMQMYPEADIYTSFYTPERLGIHKDLFAGRKIHTSWAQKVPFLKKLYSPFRFITPLIWESFDFSAYDLVISSSGSYMSHGIVTRPETLHICYLHHPPRYLYYYETAVEWQKHWPVRIYGNLINHNLRIWDYISSWRVDHYVANAQETRRRVQKLYRQDAAVIYPPVDLPNANDSHLDGGGQKYYITVSRLARAKHIDILIDAANREKFHLKVVGAGRDLDRLKSIAGNTVEFVGNVSDQELHDLYKHAKAFLFAAVDEEFGIAPVEAMGHGVPVIAYNHGGLKETVEPGVSGFLFDGLHVHSVVEAVKKLEAMDEKEYLALRASTKKHAQQYSLESFKTSFKNFVNEKIK
jgi:glycosyltransferase involved in cell wall biosynthesis